MRDGIVGNFGIDRNIESATYGRCDPVNGSNLTLTAISLGSNYFFCVGLRQIVCRGVGASAYPTPGWLGGYVGVD